MKPLVLVLGIALSGVVIAAEEIRVMSAGAVEPGIVAAIAQFERSSGNRVTVRFGTGPQLSARLDANEAADVLIAPAAVMDAAVAAGRADARTRVAVGRVGVGVVVRQGARSPDVSSRNALTDALRSAAVVVYNRGSTGQYIEKLIAELGIASVVQAKAVRVETGEAVVARIAAGTGNEIGFAAITEIRMLESKGVRMVAPLPPPVQNFTSYDAAVLTATSARSTAESFLRFITGSEGRRHLTAGGVEPVP